jgi:predicted MFS family arabinose efflux permease
MSAPAEARFFSRRWLVAIALMSSAIMEVLDTSVVNVSLPHIAGSLSSTVDEATWVLTSYIVANAIILPITGWLSNYFGRKRLLLTIVTGFTLSSVLCGLAPSLPFLIFSRVVQGTLCHQPLQRDAQNWVHHGDILRDHLAGSPVAVPSGPPCRQHFAL